MDLNPGKAYDDVPFYSHRLIHALDGPETSD